MPLQALQVLEKKIERQIRLFEFKRGQLEHNIGKRIPTKPSPTSRRQTLRSFQYHTFPAVMQELIG